MIHGPDSDGIVPEQLRDDKRVSTVPIETSEPEGLAVGVSGGYYRRRKRACHMREYTDLRSFRRWESSFQHTGEAPPKGWKRYLRDGWSQNLTEWRKRYRLYLRSNAWKQRRSGAIRRANGICAWCHQPSDRLHVHHVEYIRAGAEQVEDIRVLCKPCHAVIHTLPKQPTITMDDTTKAITMAREYRERAREYRRKAAAIAAGDMALPADNDRPKIKRRPKPLVNPTDPTPSLDSCP